MISFFRIWKYYFFKVKREYIMKTCLYWEQKCPWNMHFFLFWLASMTSITLCRGLGKASKSMHVYMHTVYLCIDRQTYKKRQSVCMGVKICGCYLSLYNYTVTNWQIPSLKCFRECISLSVLAFTYLFC